MMPRRLFLATLLLLIGSADTRAADTDRPIVYAARYYTGAASKSKSHYHLYRINPDGTGKQQITDGDRDDYAPRWDRDGIRIFFSRAAPAEEGESTTWVYNAATSKTVPLPPSTHPDMPGADQLPPDPVVSAPPAAGAKVRVDRLPREDGSSITLSAAVDEKYARPPTLAFLDKDGNVTSQVSLRPDTVARGALSNGDGDSDLSSLHLAMCLPGTATPLIYNWDGNSTDGHWRDYYSVENSTGVFRVFAQGNGLYFAPNGKRFVTTRGRTLAPLAPGDKRQVWVSPLLLGTVNADGSATVRPLLAGRVYIVGCDWRPAPRKSPPPVDRPVK